MDNKLETRVALLEKKIINEADNNNNAITYQLLQRMYRSIVSGDAPAGLDSLIKSAIKNKSVSKSDILLLIILKYISATKSSEK